MWRCESGPAGFLARRCRDMRIGMIDCQAIRKRWETVGSKLDERGRRVFAAGEVRAAGWGGPGGGLRDHGSGALDHRPRPEGSRRCAPAERPGSPQGWRPASFVEPGPDADRRSAAHCRAGHAWVSRAAVAMGLEEPRQAVAVALQSMGHRISANSVRRLLPALGYSRQSNRRPDEGSKHPDRDAQFEHINAKVIAAQAADQPVISVDTKKKGVLQRHERSSL